MDRYVVRQSLPQNLQAELKSKCPSGYELHSVTPIATNGGQTDYLLLVFKPLSGWG